MSVLAASAIRSSIPFRVPLRRVLRRVRPYKGVEGLFWWTLVQGLDAIVQLRAAGARVDGDILEIGSGWLPILPTLFRLSGARAVVLTDVERLMDDATMAEARRIVAEHLPLVAEKLGDDAARLAKHLGTPFTYDYRVPWIPRDIPDQSVDVIVSRSVLEHIPAAVLDSLVGEFYRVLRPGGMMYHLVDNSDHWQHHDRSLSRVDMLSFEDTDWRWRLALRRRFQNRLRHSDYARLFQNAGWSIVRSEAEIEEASLRTLETMPLATRFAGYERKDLATVTSVFLLRRSADPAPAREPEHVERMAWAGA